MHLWSDWERSGSCMVSARRSQMNWLHWRPKRAMNRPAVQNGGAKVAMKGEPRSRGVDALDGTKMGSWVGLTESRRTTTKSLGYYAYPHNRRSLGQFVSHGQGIEIQKRPASTHFTSELTLSIIHPIPMFSLFTKQASRKYVDLIYGVSSKWANWDPPKKLEVPISNSCLSVASYHCINARSSQAISGSSIRARGSLRRRAISTSISPPTKLLARLYRGTRPRISRPAINTSSAPPK